MNMISTLQNVESEVPLNHSDGLIPKAVAYTHLEFRREICASCIDSGVIGIEMEWMRSPMEDVKNKKRTLAETLGWGNSQIYRVGRRGGSYRGDPGGIILRNRENWEGCYRKREDSFMKERDKVRRQR